MKANKAKALLEAMTDGDDGSLVELLKMQIAAAKEQTAAVERMVAMCLAANEQMTDKMLALVDVTARRVDGQIRRTTRGMAVGGGGDVASIPTPGADRHPSHGEDDEDEPIVSDVTDTVLAHGAPQFGDRIGPGFRGRA